MKKFSFKLETVLKLKEKILNDKMLELAKIMRILSDARDTLNVINQKRTDASDDIAESNSDGKEIDVKSVEMYRNYLTKLDAEIKNQEHLIIQIQRAVEDKQREVNEALKERDILKKLKEKQLQKHNAEIDHKERVELDDMAISRYKAS